MRRSCAALKRRAPAIRDFYDIYYAVTHLNLDIQDRSFTALVRKKLAVPGNDPIDISTRRREVLQRQVEAQLSPVLRPQDFLSFQLDNVFDLVAEVGARIQKTKSEG